MSKQQSLMVIGAALVILGVTTLLIFFTACSSPQKYIQSPANIGFSDDIAEQHRRAVRVVVECPWTDELRVKFSKYYDRNPDYMPFRGSGVIVDDRHIITANHVVCGDGDKYTVHLEDTRQYDVHVLRRFPKQDIALLETAKSMGFKTLERAEPEIGKEVCVVAGTPQRSRTCGVVLYVSSEPFSGDIAHGAVVIPGNSGSGTYDLQGRLVGIVVKLVWCLGDLLKPEKERKVCGGRSSSLRGIK